MEVNKEIKKEFKKTLKICGGGVYIYGVKERCKMNIEVNLKKLKMSIKRRKKITLTLMLGFLMTGVIGYAEPTSGQPKPTLESLQNEITELKKQNKKLENKLNSDKVEIGEKASVINGGGVSGSNPKGAIAIGENATVSNYIDQSGGIAIGQNAYAESMVGYQDKYFAFNKDIKYSETGKKKTPENEYNHLMTTLAIGNNTYARSGSIMIGPHNFRGEMGDIDNISTDTVDGVRNLGLGAFATTLGSNSFTMGSFAATLGAYSIITSKYDGSKDNKKFFVQNLGALINGSLNSIESKVVDNKYSGIANSVVGFANRANNSNGTMIFGAGNEVTNSVDEIGNYDIYKEYDKDKDVVKNVKHFHSVKELAKNLREQYSNGSVGGSTLVFGSGNKVDCAKYANITGSKNKVTGTKGKKSENNIVNGNDNEITEASNNIVYGTKYRIKKKSIQPQTRSAQDTGTQTEDPNGNILFGHNDEYVDITVKNTVVIGDNIKPNLDNSVYLGTKSTEAKGANTLWKKENIDQAYREYAGFDHIGGIVTVGNDTLTRVIQNVAPGLISATSTDAINGSQLYNYVAKQYITIKDGKGGETKVKLGDTLTLKGTTIDVTVKKPEPTQTNVNQPAVAPQPVAPVSEPKTPQEHTVTYETDTFEYKLRDDKGNVTTLIEGADGKLYTQDFLDKNEYKNDKWINKDTNNEIEESVLKGNQHEKTDGNVILSTKYGNIISNVSDGKEDKDAVNVSQLNDVKSKLQKDIKEVDKKSDLALGGVSNAVAMANLPQVMGDKKFNLAASYGYYGGSHAVAVGFSGTNDNQNFIYKLSGSVNNKGNLAFGIGAGVMLGEVNNKDKKIEDLTKENKEIKENLRNQSAEIQELKEIVRRLMKK